MNEYTFLETNCHVDGRGMMQTGSRIFLLLALPGFAQPAGQWVLEKSTLSYHVSHPLHETEGTSHAARGKVVCQAGQCDVLIATPVKSFDSGDSNRDLHMLQATHGAQFPIVSVRIRLPESDFGSPTVRCDLEIEFAGQTVQLPAGSIPAGERGKLHADLGNDPGYAFRFQDSPAFALDSPRQE
jgi:hypothetical protein